MPRPLYETRPQTFLGLTDDCIPKNPRVRVLPVPYAGSVSYGTGAHGGPQAIITASREVELWDEETDTQPWREGILTLPAVEPSVKGPGDQVQKLLKISRKLLTKPGMLFTLGGEHSITLPLVRAHHERYPGLSVLQLDAHADLRASYQGSPYSHACVMNRLTEFIPTIVQVGIRAISPEERDLVRSGRTTVITGRDVATTPDWMERAWAALSDPVYLTLDIDALDPSLMPATGTPEPGGMMWYPLMDFLAGTFARFNVVGMDLVELAPIPGMHAPDFLAARLAHRMIAWWCKTHPVGGTK